MSLCLPVFTKVSAEVGCATGTDCFTTYGAITPTPTDALTITKMYTTAACTNALSAEGASNLAVKTAIAATTIYVML